MSEPKSNRSNETQSSVIGIPTSEPLAHGSSGSATIRETWNTDSLMPQFKEKSLIFFVALDLFATGKAECPKDAFDIWPQKLVPASLNAVKIAYARIRARQYAQYCLTPMGEKRAAEARQELEQMLADRDHAHKHPINSVFALGSR